ncbi:MAG: ATP-binding protein [Vulcanimicrobiota bacterium]
MTTWLLAVHIKTGDKQWFPLPVVPFLVGRRSAGDEAGKLVIDFDPSISRQHFNAQWDEEKLHIQRDSRSKHSLFFKGEPVDTFSLSCGECFSTGSTRFQIMKEGPSEKATESFAQDGASPFSPIRNPYVAGNPITDSALFFGRDDVFNFLRNKLTQTAERTTVVIYGGRRTGKTSVLLQIMNGRLGEGFIPAYIDLQMMADVDTHEFFESLQEAISRALKKQGVTADYSDFSDKSKNPYRMFDSFLDSIETVLGKNAQAPCLLLLFDEYEILDGKVKRGHLSDEIFTYFRAMMQNRTSISFIFTGTRQLELLRGAHWTLMFNQAVYRKISFMDERDALDLIEMPLRGQAIYHPGAVKAIVRLTSGHPYFIQLLCLTLVESINLEQTRVISEEHVEKAIYSLCRHPVPHLIYLWKERSRNEQLILSSLSEFLPDSGTYAPVRELEKLLAEEKIDLSREQITSAIGECLKDEFLEHSGKREYRYKMDFLRHWIKEAHPLWKLAEEKDTQ